LNAGAARGSDPSSSSSAAASSTGRSTSKPSRRRAWRLERAGLAAQGALRGTRSLGGGGGHACRRSSRFAIRHLQCRGWFPLGQPMQRKNSLDRSARKLLICMGIVRGPCGLRPHSRARGRRENRPGESEAGPEGCTGGDRRSPQASARTRDNTRLLARSDEKKPQPRVVGAYGLVEPGGIEPPSASHCRSVLHA
jgi:hypothetical protein